MADWSALPCDILGAIVLKLDPFEDFARFSVVCRSWRCAFLEVKQLCQPTTPWLFLAESKEENPEGLRKLFNLHTNRCLERKLPETIGRRCWGSNYGWIVTVGLDREMHLFNPLTKTRLCLPSQQTLPNQPVKKMDDDDEWARTCFVQRAIVLRIREDEEFLVMVVYGEWCDLAFARPGDHIWTPIDIYGEISTRDLFIQMRGVSDICYYDGKILVIFGNGALGYCDITSSHPKVLDYLPIPRYILDNRRDMLYKLYLVNSFGDLLIVLRHKAEVYHEEEHSYETKRLDVFRPNFHTKDWEKVKELGDVVLFIGDSCSVSVSASHLQRNHIYFTDDEFQFWESLSGADAGGHDMGAYNMEGGKIVPFYEGCDFRSSFCTPLWFIPKF